MKTGKLNDFDEQVIKTFESARKQIDDLYRITKELTQRIEELEKKEG